MNDDLSPDPELRRRLDAAQADLTADLPRRDARIDSLLGAGPPLADRPDGPPVLTDVAVVDITAPSRPAVRERVGVVASVAATLLMFAGFGALALSSGTGAPSLDAVGPAAEPEGALETEGDAEAEPDPEPQEGAPSDPEPDSELEPGHGWLFPDDLEQHFDGHFEWLMCITEEFDRELPPDVEPPFGIESCGDLPPLGEFPRFSPPREWLECADASTPDRGDGAGYCLWHEANRFEFDDLGDVCRSSEEHGLQIECVWPPCTEGECEATPCPAEGESAGCFHFGLEFGLQFDPAEFPYSLPSESGEFPWPRWFSEPDPDDG